MVFDYIIVGAGSAGCVLAERLSADGRFQVLLLEAGGVDSHPLVHMPKGYAKLFFDPRCTWHLQTEGDGDIPSETWIRGKLLGGSSSINGTMYFRGHPEDYNDWERLGAVGWGWKEMLRAFTGIERHEHLAGSTSGLLGISFSSAWTELNEAFIAAGCSLGVPRVPDLNHAGQEGVGYVSRTIFSGRRQSAASAFLRPARGRLNLHIESGVTVDRVLVDGNRAIGVAGRRAGGTVEFRARIEVILSAGALHSPQILERSGIGDPRILNRLGIKVLHDSPGVGEHLLEHRLLMMHYKLIRPLSLNAEFRGWRALVNGLRYFLTRSGPLSDGSHDIGAFIKTAADLDRPDVEILMAPYALALDFRGTTLATDSDHSIHMFGYPLRSRSEGRVHIGSANPDAPASIRANYLSDPYDRQVTLAMFRLMRRWVRQAPLEGIIGEEVLPGAAVQSDADILLAFRTRGQAGFHACGTVRMGGSDAVLNPRLEVRGLSALRVVDGSVMPTMVSANTNGPIMAIAWRASELILEDVERTTMTARYPLAPGKF